MSRRSITEVVLDNGETFKGKQFISNVHPAVTIDIFGAGAFFKCV
jgi:all-trans-retinol 13,14-reductase